MKKTSLILIVALLLVFSAVSLMGCGLFKEIKFDEVKANLENAGYQVTVLTGEEYVQREDAYPSIFASELEQYINAVKGEDHIEIFFFTTVDIASSNANFITGPGLYEGQSNKVVYIGTKQARSDAKIG